MKKSKKGMNPFAKKGDAAPKKGEKPSFKKGVNPFAKPKGYAMGGAVCATPGVEVKGTARGMGAAKRGGNFSY